MRKKGMLVLGIMAAATAIGILFWAHEENMAVTGRAVSRPCPSLVEKKENINAVF